MERLVQVFTADGMEQGVKTSVALEEEEGMVGPFPPPLISAGGIRLIPQSGRSLP